MSVCSRVISPVCAVGLALLAGPSLAAALALGDADGCWLPQATTTVIRTANATR
jgi:hypothetical protein